MRCAHTGAPEFVLAVIDVESNFDRFAISASSALGLMQVMPFWVPQLGYKDKNELFKIDTNTLLGCQILRYYLDMERGDFVKASRATTAASAGAGTPTGCSNGCGRSGARLKRASQPRTSKRSGNRLGPLFHLHARDTRGRRPLPQPRGELGERFEPDRLRPPRRGRPQDS